MDKLKAIFRLKGPYDNDLAPSEIVSRLWPLAGSGKSAQYREFLHHVGDELTKFHDFPGDFSINTAHTFLELVSALQALSNLDHSAARHAVSSISGRPFTADVNSDQNTAHLRTLESALSIWTNICIVFPRRGLNASPPKSLPWTGGTLEELVQKHFDAKRRASENLFASRPQVAQQRTLDPNMTAEYLFRAYGYHLMWTSNLAEHLKLDHQAKTITVFEHKICLWNIQRFSGNKTPLPAAVVDEVLDTLNLLFPWGDEATESFLRRKPAFYGLGKCNRERQLNPQAYRYWGTEIENLSQILAQPPRGRAQLLIDKDGTNLLEVWTFWAALLFGLLAVIGVVTGVYSSVYAKWAYDSGIMQYKLALAQACSIENATELLPGFCS